MNTLEVVALIAWWALWATTTATCITGRPRCYYRLLDGAWEQVVRPARWLETTRRTWLQRHRRDS